MSVISTADPAARWTGADKGPAYFAYATSYLIDYDHAVIVDVEATAAVRQAGGRRGEDDDRACARAP